MLQLWPIAVPAIVVVAVAVTFVRRAWTERVPVATVEPDAAPAVPGEQLRIRRSSADDLVRVGALVEPEAVGSLGGRLLRAVDAVPPPRDPQLRRVAVRRRQRPLTAA